MLDLRVNSVTGYAISPARVDAIKANRLEAQKVEPVKELSVIGKQQVIRLPDVTQSSVVDELMEVANKRIHAQFAVYDQSSSQPSVDVIT